MRLLRGRLFTESDNAGSQLVAVVSRKMAERYWPSQDPIGKRLRRGMPETATPWMTVVGEVDDIKLGAPDEETTPQVYQPIMQAVASEGVFAAPGELSATNGWIVLRSRIAPEQMENILRAAVQKIDPQLPLYQMQTMEHAISDSEAPRRFNTVLISSFAIAAVLLSVLGIYAVVAFSAALREQEMAVRMALAVSVRGCSCSSLVLASSLLQLAVPWACLALWPHPVCCVPFFLKLARLIRACLHFLPWQCYCWRSQRLRCRQGAHPVRIPCWLCEANRNIPKIFGNPACMQFGTLEI
jgi:hypothetical protein